MQLKHFNYWCQKVLPLVYDDSLSYYEVLCKVVDYINKIIGDSNSVLSEIDELKAELKTVENWINNFNVDYLEELVRVAISNSIKTVSFGLSSEGYFMAIVPESWKDIKFDTIQSGELYGHLTLSYD